MGLQGRLSDAQIWRPVLTGSRAGEFGAHRADQVRRLHVRAVTPRAGRLRARSGTGAIKVDGAARSGGRVGSADQKTQIRRLHTPEK